MKAVALSALAVVLALPVLADTSQDVNQLVSEKMKLERKVVGVFAKAGLSEDPEYKKLSQEAMDAAKAYSEARRDHPDLKPHYEASDAAKKEMIDAQRAGDQVARKAAISKLTKARVELETASAKIPELKEAREKAQAANDAAGKRRIELLAGTEEGKPLVEELEKLDARIKEMREAKMKE